MSDIIKHSKKALSIATTITTIAWSLGLSAFALPLAAQAAAGDLVKATGSKAVYLVDADGVTIHPFPHANVYSSWGFPADFSSTITTDLSGFKVGNDVEFRDGSLVRAKETPAVYVKADGKLMPVNAYETFTALGYKDANITWLPQTFLDKYAAGTLLTSTATHPNGTVVKYANSSTLYLLQGGMKKEFATTDVAKVNGYAKIPVITIPSSETYPDGAKIVVREASLTVPTGVGAAPGTTTPPVTPAGSGLTVSVASDNPVAATILSDDTANAYPQALIPFLKLNFAAGSDGAVKVTTVKVTRTGVSSDSDIGNVYLYDGGTKLAEFSSFSTKVVTFSNSSGLFTVDAGSTKTITVKGDLARASTSVASGKTVGFNLASAADVTTDKATVSGSFPISSALMSTAQVTDLGHLYLTFYNTFPATIKADASNQEMWRFTVNATNQDMELRKVRMTMVGTIATTDIKDLKLEVGGVGVGTTQQIAVDKTVTFDLSATPYLITSGQSKVFVLRGTMNGGSGKAFKFTIQRQADLEGYDRNYGVFNPVTITGDTTAFALVEPETGNGTDVSSGTITSGVASDSPSGNVADGATGVALGKFSFCASGESVKVDSLGVTVAISNNDGGEAAVGLVNVKLLLDGSQIGTTASTMTTSATATTFSFGNTFQVTSGGCRYVTVQADLTNSSLETNDTIAVTLDSAASNAQAMTTLTALSTADQTARTLTVKSGTATLTKNTAFANRSSTNPTGTTNAQGVQIASFIITAGAGEAVDVTQMVLKDADATSQVGDNFTNLKIKNGTTQIGETIGTPDSSGTASTYTFTPGTAIRIAAGAQYVVDVYADIKSSPQDSGDGSTTEQTLNGNGVIEVDAISATGVSTSADAGVASPHNLALQNGYIISGGNLTITQDGDTPIAQQVVMGSLEQTVARFKLAASVAEDITISDIYLAAQVSSAGTGTYSNFKLYNGITPVGTASNFGTTSTTTYAVAPFTGLSLTVPRNSNIILTVKADISTAANGTSAATAVFALLPDYDGATSGNQEAITAKGASSGTSLTAGSLDFTNTAGTVDAAVVGNTFTAYATKLSVAFGTSISNGPITADSPSGSTYSAGGDDQQIAKITLTNTANAGNYSATIKYMNFALSQSGTSKAVSSAVEIKVYKDNLVSTGTLVATTTYTAASNLNLGTTAFTNGTDSSTNFIDTDVSAGTSKTFIVTLDTDQLSMTADTGAESISIGMGASGIAWRDGVYTTDITVVNTLPLSAKTLNYPAT